MTSRYNEPKISYFRLRAKPKEIDLEILEKNFQNLSDVKRVKTICIEGKKPRFDSKHSLPTYMTKIHSRISMNSLSEEMIDSNHFVGSGYIDPISSFRIQNVPKGGSFSRPNTAGKSNYIDPLIFISKFNQTLKLEKRFEIDPALIYL